MEMDRVNIITKVSMMASHMAIPREVHLEAVLYVFAFIRHKYKSRVAFEPIYTTFNTSDFKECKFKDFYGKLEEAIPPNSPKVRGKKVDLRGYVDSDHTGERKTQMYHSRFSY